MIRYFLTRLVLMIPTLLGVIVLVFVLLRVVPGDVVEMRFASGQNQFVDQKMLDAERAKLGLDKPIWQQFVAYLTGLLRLVCALRDDEVAAARPRLPRRAALGGL